VPPFAFQEIPMAMKKNVPPKTINLAAKALRERKFNQRIVKSKKLYSRKRRDAAGLAPFGFQTVLRAA
jgi:hypothetical protein